LNFILKMSNVIFVRQQSDGKPPAYDSIFRNTRQNDDQYQIPVPVSQLRTLPRIDELNQNRNQQYSTQPYYIHPNSQFYFSNNQVGPEITSMGERNIGNACLYTFCFFIVTVLVIFFITIVIVFLVI
jgi:hypothetical protein